MRLRLFFLCLCGPLIASEEGLALRRIADFWEEGEYSLAKSQMEEFLESYPDSSYSNTLRIALGDLFLREKDYNAALEYYSHVENREDVFLNRLQCLYHLEWHATLADECETYLKQEGPHRLQATYFLAIALYSQALQSENPVPLAERAKPYFELLAQSELSDEVAGAFAHLRCLLGEYEEASKIYLQLASQNDSNELRFQAALVQSKFDKNLALETFSQIQTGSYGAMSVYNQLVLFFDQRRFEEIISQKEKFFQAVPPEKMELAHLFVGESYLALQRYEESVGEFRIFLETAKESGPALAHLAEAAYHLGDLELLDGAIARMEDKSHALFLRAHLLKKAQRWEEARDQLKTAPESPDVLFELVQVESQLKNWTAVYERAMEFMAKYPTSEQALFAWQYAATAALELHLVTEMEELLKTAPNSDWQFLFAKMLFEIGEYNKSVEIAKTLTGANAELLQALCLQKLGDEEGFCTWAEKALVNDANLMPAADQRIALFNSYISRSQFEQARDHLFAAFELDAKIQWPNLLWLADFAQGEKAYRILLHIAGQLKEPELLLKLAKLHRQFGKEAEAVALLETLELPEAKLVLGEILLPSDSARAEGLFDEAAKSDTYRNGVAARAALLHARMKIAAGQKEMAAIILKNLVLQKNLENEPVYIDASKEYIQLFPEKRQELLKKAKIDFESTDDLLSKDYQAARAKFADIDALVRAYISALDDEIKHEAE